MNDSLYLRYRPTAFKDVTGHPEIIRSLKAALDEKLNQAFLLSGPSGVGKTTLARIAATHLGCQHVQEIDAATFTGIDAMREITKTFSYRPLNDEVRVLIVNECQGLSKAAWESLLMSVEEPPPWLYWFFTTTDPAKVPAAVVTRCTNYTLKLIPSNQLIELLEYVAAEEGVLGDDVGASIIKLCARSAEGSPRQALVNLGTCLTARSKEEAATLLESAEETSEAVELARLLVNGASWEQVRALLEVLKEQNPESVRHVVRGYVTKVIMGAKKKPPENLFAILEAFSTPFPSADQLSPLVLAIGKMMQ